MKKAIDMYEIQKNNFRIKQKIWVLKNNEMPTKCISNKGFSDESKVLSIELSPPNIKFRIVK